jgi:hypothetical protein
MATQFNDQAFKLKYYFKCEYKDGSIFEQNEEDVSLTDPKRSAFFDIRQKDVARFWLEGNGHKYLVDLTTGLFEIDGNLIHVGEDLPAIDPVRRLIFFRRHAHQFNLDHEEVGHFVRYFIGWQTTINGKNYKQTIAVA